MSTSPRDAVATGPTSAAPSGTYNGNMTDMWQEGLRITPVKIMERGERRADVWELIFGNVRLDIVADDVDAMIGACTVGEREMSALPGGLRRRGLPGRGGVAAGRGGPERGGGRAAGSPTAATAPS